MKYLINSAVITNPGLYRYELVSPAFAAAWVRARGWVSRIGYAETADYIERLSGIRPGISREASPMEPGDEALVVRLKYRVADPARKGSTGPADDDWELGLLVRVR